MKNNQNTKTTNKTQTINKWTLIKEINEMLGFETIDDNSNMVGWFVDQSKENLKKIRTKLKVLQKETKKLFDVYESLRKENVDVIKGVINFDKFVSLSTEKQTKIIVDSGYKI